MKLVLTLLVRNEEDVLEDNLDFHLSQGVDFVIATDNASTDATPEILSRYERAGVLRRIFEPDDTYSQHRWVTRMARLASAEHGATWVINADADEFWWPLAGDLESTLRAVPAEIGVVRVPRVNFHPTTRAEGRFYERMTVRDVVSLNSLGEPLPPKICHRAFPDAVVAQGNHALLAPAAAALPEPAPILILHFPVRAYERFERKIVDGGRAYERNAELPQYVGATWRTLYRGRQRGAIRAYYDSVLLDEEHVDAAMRERNLVRDRRLEAYMHALRAGGRAGRPER